MLTVKLFTKVYPLAFNAFSQAVRKMQDANKKGQVYE